MNIEFKENAVCYANGRQWFFNDSVKPYQLVCNMHGTFLETLEGVLSFDDFQLNKPKQGDYLPKSELDTEKKYNDAVEVFRLFGFNLSTYSEQNYDRLKMREFEYLGLCDAKLIAARNSLFESKRKLTYNQLMAIGKLKRLMNERTSSAVSKVNLDIERAVKITINDELDKPVNSELKDGDKYIRTICGLDGVKTTVDVYRVLDAFPSGSAAIDHAAKKVLCAGLRGHKDKLTDIDNAIESLQAARLLLIQKR